MNIFEGCQNLRFRSNPPSVLPEEAQGKGAKGSQRMLSPLPAPVFHFCEWATKGKRRFATWLAVRPGTADLAPSTHGHRLQECVRVRQRKAGVGDSASNTRRLRQMFRACMPRTTNSIPDCHGGGYHKPIVGPRESGFAAIPGVSRWSLMCILYNSASLYTGLLDQDGSGVK